MAGERIVGTALLAVTLVFGMALSIMPLGATWVEDPNTGTRQTETYSMFSKVRETTPAGEAGDGVGTTWYYADAGLDGSGGITFLRLMGPLMIAAMALTVAAFVLTVIPKTSPRRAGGWVALPAAVMFVSSIVLVVLGTAMHAAGMGRPAPQTDWNMAASTVAVFGILSITIPAGMGLVRIRREASDDGTWTDDSVPAGAQHEALQHGMAEETWDGQGQQEWDEQPAQAEQWDQWGQQPAPTGGQPGVQAPQARSQQDQPALQEQQQAWDQHGGQEQQQAWDQHGGQEQQQAWDQHGGQEQPGQWAQEGGWEQSQQQEWNQQPTSWQGDDQVAEHAHWHDGSQQAAVAIRETGTRVWVAGRNLRCPDCSTVVTTGFGVVPICPECQFGSDYTGPAAPPVTARAVPN